MAEAERLPGAVRGPAAIDGEGVAVDEAALRGVAQEEDGACDVAGCGEAGHGDAVDDVVVGVGGAGLIDVVHLGLDPAGADGVDTDVAGAPFGGEGAGEADEAVLGGVVGTAVAYAGESCDGGDVDDASLLLLEHEGTEAAREQEGRNEIDLEDAAEVGGGDGFGGGDEADACVVDEDVGAAPAAADGIDAMVDEGFVGEVAEEFFAVGGGSDMSAGLAVEEGKGVSGLGEELGSAAPDALRGPGNDGDFGGPASGRDIHKDMIRG